MFFIKGLKLYWIKSNLGTFKLTNCLRINTLKACPGTDVLAKINKCNRGKHCGKTNEARAVIFELFFNQIKLLRLYFEIKKIFCFLKTNCPLNIPHSTLHCTSPKLKNMEEGLKSPH